MENDSNNTIIVDEDIGEETALAIQESNAISDNFVIANVQWITAFQRNLQKLKKEILIENQDYVITKINDRNRIIFFRCGWEKIAFVFGISVEIIDKQRIDQTDKNGNKQFTWVFTVKAYSKNKSIQSDGVGACSSNEGKKFTHLEHDVLATAHTRAKGRAICSVVGAGLTFEEIADIGDTTIKEITSKGIMTNSNQNNENSTPGIKTSTSQPQKRKAKINLG